MVLVTGREVVLKCKVEFLTGYVEFGRKTALVGAGPTALVDARPSAVKLVIVMFDCGVWVECNLKDGLPALLTVV